MWSLISEKIESLLDWYGKLINEVLLCLIKSRKYWLVGETVIGQGNVFVLIIFVLWHPTSILSIPVLISSGSKTRISRVTKKNIFSWTSSLCVNMVNDDHQGRDCCTFFLFICCTYKLQTIISQQRSLSITLFIAEELSLHVPLNGIVLAGRLPLHRPHAPRPRWRVPRPGGDLFYYCYCFYLSIALLFWSFLLFWVFPQGASTPLVGERWRWDMRQVGRRCAERHLWNLSYDRCFLLEVTGWSFLWKRDAAMLHLLRGYAGWFGIGLRANLAIYGLSEYPLLVVVTAGEYQTVRGLVMRPAAVKHPTTCRSLEFEECWAKQLLRRNY